MSRLGQLGWWVGRLLRRLAFKLEGSSKMAVAVDGMLLEGLSQVHRMVDFKSRGIRDDERLELELIEGPGANLLFEVVGRKTSVGLIIYGLGELRHQAVYRIKHWSHSVNKGCKFEFERGAIQ